MGAFLNFSMRLLGVHFLTERLRVARSDLVDDSVYFETDYRPLWPETFAWESKPKL